MSVCSRGTKEEEESWRKEGRLKSGLMTAPAEMENLIPRAPESAGLVQLCGVLGKTGCGLTSSMHPSSTAAASQPASQPAGRPTFATLPHTLYGELGLAVLVTELRWAVCTEPHEGSEALVRGQGPAERPALVLLQLRGRSADPGGTGEKRDEVLGEARRTGPDEDIRVMKGGPEKYCRLETTGNYNRQYFALPILLRMHGPFVYIVSI
ncbi:hypothetical protein EYF80_032517 [Liparis tanakae]|uniref:Uncharacterized protein n=1 Tax=Liparis tanakae TaxID=230148 RepID=A0A4Z2GUI0_9TELE|nr:hypothetical protein EYF80_032517 [Liparis tanakae]